MVWLSLKIMQGQRRAATQIWAQHNFAGLICFCPRGIKEVLRPHAGVLLHQET